MIIQINTVFVPHSMCVNRQTCRLASTKAMAPWGPRSYGLERSVHMSWWTLGHVWRGGIGLGLGDDVLVCLETLYDTQGGVLKTWLRGFPVWSKWRQDFFFTEQPKVEPFFISRTKSKLLMFLYLFQSSTHSTLFTTMGTCVFWPG